MEYFCKKELEPIRKSDEYKDGEIDLYIVYRHLGMSVTKIHKITKKHVYYIFDGNINRIPYPSKAAGYSVFDNQAEAWKRYKELYSKKKARVEEDYQFELTKLKIYEEILEECRKNTPEYYL